MAAGGQIGLAAALDGAGWHPAAWRAEGARPGGLFTARYWAGLAREAERGLLDFVTIEDELGPGRPAGGDRPAEPGQVRGRLDAALIAARVAPVTSGLGLVPTVTTTHTEPFHVSTALATLDYVSSGRAGWRARVSAGRASAGHFGRRDFPDPGPAGPGTPWTGAVPVPDKHVTGLFGEAADAVEVVRRLWDSWEDDAVIRDVATGRFIDREKLHYIDFEGPWFSVRGPSITPRPPQGQPVVTALAHGGPAYRFAARAADLVYITPPRPGHARGLIAEVRAAEAEAGRRGEPLRVYADLVVFLAPQAGAAASRKARLDDLAGAEYAPDAAVFTGTPERLARALLEWREAGLDGFRLRPGALPYDLEGITRALVPALQARGGFRRGYAEPTLRARLGLSRPPNRYASPAVRSA